MKKLLLLLSSLALPVFAHPGHIGPETHGDATHMMLGFVVALPLLAGSWWILRARNLRRAAVRVASEKNPG